MLERDQFRNSPTLGGTLPSFTIVTISLSFPCHASVSDIQSWIRRIHAAEANISLIIANPTRVVPSLKPIAQQLPTGLPRQLLQNHV